MSFTKTAPDERAARWEAAGLAWLAAAAATPVVRVLERRGPALTLERLAPTAPTAAAAEDLGRGLAALHDAGADAFGSPPDGWDGDGYLGPNDDLLPLPLAPAASFGSYYADACLLPTAALARDRGRLPRELDAPLDAVCARLHAGEFDGDTPARIHGDLWSGNVVWTDAGATLIDPAAHGGHRETDLALLALFGAPHLERVLSAYADVHPLAAGWRERVGLHQLHHLLVHVACFGGSYAAQTLAVLRRYA